MPRTAVIPAMLGATAPYRLAIAAGRWGDTTTAVIRRLRDLELPHEWSSRRTLTKLGREDEAPAPANPDLSESSQLLPKAVRWLQARGLPLHATAELTALNVDELPRWPAQPQELLADDEKRDVDQAMPPSGNSLGSMLPAPIAGSGPGAGRGHPVVSWAPP